MRIFRVLRAVFHLSLQDFFAMHSLKTYLIAWVPRIATQIAFFALLTQYAGGAAFSRFALVGNAVYLLALTSIVFVTASVNWERRAGTLPLIIASPTSPLLVLSGRNIGMALHGYLTGLVGLLMIMPFLGFAPGPGAIAGLLVMLLAVSFGCYGLGLVIGSIALRTRQFHNVLSNFINLVLLTVAGINVPADVLPTWLQHVGSVLPVSNGLAAIRLILDGGPLDQILAFGAREVALGVGYALIAQWSFRVLLTRSRMAGTVDIF